MTYLEAVRKARDKAVIAALRVAAVTLQLATDDKATGNLVRADETFYLACRDVTSAVGDLPLTARPKGWGTGPDGDTA